MTCKDGSRSLICTERDKRPEANSALFLISSGYEKKKKKILEVSLCPMARTLLLDVSCHPQKEPFSSRQVGPLS